MLLRVIPLYLQDFNALNHTKKSTEEVYSICSEKIKFELEKLFIQ